MVLCARHWAGLCEPQSQHLQAVYGMVETAKPQWEAGCRLGVIRSLTLPSSRIRLCSCQQSICTTPRKTEDLHSQDLGLPTKETSACLILSLGDNHSQAGLFVFLIASLSSTSFSSVRSNTWLPPLHAFVLCE